MDKTMSVIVKSSDSLDIGTCRIGGYKEHDMIFIARNRAKKIFDSLEVMGETCPGMLEMSPIDMDHLSIRNGDYVEIKEAPIPVAYGRYAKEMHQKINEVIGILRDADNRLLQHPEHASSMERYEEYVNRCGADAKMAYHTAKQIIGIMEMQKFGAMREFTKGKV